MKRHITSIDIIYLLTNEELIINLENGDSISLTDGAKQLIKEGLK